MKLVHMGREEDGQAPEVMPGISPYPYGLRLNLTHEELLKVGYDELPQAGTICKLEAVAVVTRSSTEDPDADGDCDFCSIELQITELGMEEQEGGEEEDTDNDAVAHRLYGKE
jgi:major coat protein